jgi:hypothetical protein
MMNICVATTYPPMPIVKPRSSKFLPKKSGRSRSEYLPAQAIHILSIRTTNISEYGKRYQRYLDVHECAHAHSHLGRVSVRLPFHGNESVAGLVLWPPLLQTEDY